MEPPLKPKSRHALAEPITQVAIGVAIYRTHASPFWFARVRQGSGYKVKSTKETHKLAARKVALELATENRQPLVAKEFRFKHYAHKYITKAKVLAARGELNSGYVRSQGSILDNQTWGLIKIFGDKDVRTLTSRDYNLYDETLTHSPATRNIIKTAWRNVMKAARHDDIITAVPTTDPIAREDNPRPFFWFRPLVEDDKDEYAGLLLMAKAAAIQKDEVRRTIHSRSVITTELYDFISFAVASFLRPTTSELFAIRHRDIEIVDNPKRLLVYVKKGKTGSRAVNTMPNAVAAYLRQKETSGYCNPDDFVWVPKFTNRVVAQRVIGDQFNHILERAKLKICPKTGLARTLYSLRHTAICMRLATGNVNIFNLAKNAGTSVETIERFYGRKLPLTPAMVANLHGDRSELQDFESWLGN